MHTLSEVIDAITDILQVQYRNNDSNYGLVLGPQDKKIQEQIPVKKITVSLNLSAYNIARAVNQKADLIISYEPLFYSCIKRIDYTLLRKIRLLAKDRVYVFVLGDALIYCENGVNDTLMGLLDIKETYTIEERVSFQSTENNRKLKVGRLVREVMVRELARDIGKKVRSRYVKILGNPTDFVKEIAFVGGVIRDKKIIEFLKSSNVDTIITGDIDYRIQTYLQDLQLNTLIIGYANSINPGLRVFKNLLQLKVPEAEVSLLDTENNTLASEINIA